MGETTVLLVLQKAIKFIQRLISLVLVNKTGGLAKFNSYVAKPHGNKQPIGQQKK